MTEAKKTKAKECKHEYMISNWRRSSLNEAAFEVMCKLCLKVVKKPEIDAINRG